MQLGLCKYGNTETMQRIVQAAVKRAEMVSTLPAPGRAFAAADVDCWAFVDDKGRRAFFRFR